MKNIIEAIYDGDLSLIEDIVVNDRRYREDMKTQCATEEELQ